MEEKNWTSDTAVFNEGTAEKVRKDFSINPFYYQMLREIDANIEDEHSAISGYNKLRNAMDQFLSEESGSVAAQYVEEMYAEIAEIIADELDHSRRLRRFEYLLTGIAPADG